MLKLEPSLLSSVQFLSRVSLCDPMDHSTSGLPVHHQPPEFTQTHVHWVSDAIQPSHPLSSPSPPAFNPYQHQGLFKCVSSSHKVTKYWSFSFNISPSNEYSGLISFRMDCLDLLAVQGTLKGLLQHHSSKSSILHHSAFFTVQLSHPDMTTGKTIALTSQTFVGKVTSLLLNMLSTTTTKTLQSCPTLCDPIDSSLPGSSIHGILQAKVLEWGAIAFSMLSRLVITFLPRSKRLLISWLQSPSVGILEPPSPNKLCHCFHCFPIYLPWSDGTRCHDLSFLNVEL